MKDIYTEQGFDVKFPLTHCGGIITRIEKGREFDGLFTMPGTNSCAGLGNESHQTTFLVKSIMSESDWDVSYCAENYKKAIEFIKSEYPDADDDLIELLYDLIAGDKDVFEMEINPLADYGFLDDDLGRVAWKGQQLRGQLASHLGYDAVAMRDETGISYLIPYQADYVIVEADELDEIIKELINNGRIKTRMARVKTQ